MNQDKKIDVYPRKSIVLNIKWEFLGCPLHALENAMSFNGLFFFNF